MKQKIKIKTKYDILNFPPKILGFFFLEFVPMMILPPAQPPFFVFQTLLGFLIASSEFGFLQSTQTEALKPRFQTETSTTSRLRHTLKQSWNGLEIFRLRAHQGIVLWAQASLGYLIQWKGPRISLKLLTGLDYSTKKRVLKLRNGSGLRKPQGIILLQVLQSRNNLPLFQVAFTQGSTRS